jgi:hypothetical protein
MGVVDRGADDGGLHCVMRGAARAAIGALSVRVAGAMFEGGA